MQSLFTIKKCTAEKVEGNCVFFFRLMFTLETVRALIFASVHHMWTKGNVISAINLCYQEAEKEVNRLSRYKRQLDNRNSRLESELEEARKLITARDQVSERMVDHFVTWDNTG